jgi:hypothetical protein
MPVYDLDLDHLDARETRMLFDLGRVVRSLVREGHPLALVGAFADAQLRRGDLAVRASSIPAMLDHLSYLAVTESVEAQGRTGRAAA